MTLAVSNFLIKADRVCDHIPVVGTVTNLIDLFQKCCFIPLKKATHASRYYTHIKDKSALRCVLLMIPVLGQILVYFLKDKINNHEKNHKLASLRKNGLELQYASDACKSDPDIVRAAVGKDGMALQFALALLRKSILRAVL